MMKLFFSTFFILLLQTCGKTLLVPVCESSDVTYENGIALILEDNCNSKFCHGSDSKNGDWTSFQNLKPALENGSFEKSVLIDQTMPKNGVRLSQEEINLIQCWLEQGFLEK